MDSLRPDALSCYGGPGDQGAAICSVADRGALYLWAFTPVPTGAAAAASMLTSRYPAHHRVRAETPSFLSSDQATFTELLVSKGYRAAAFVSSPELNRSRNLHQAFDHFDDRLDRSDAQNPRRDAPETTEAALSWLAGRSSPWLLWVHFGDLHGPYPPPAIPNYEEYARRYAERLRAVDAEVSRLLARVDEGEAPAGVLLVGLHGEAIGENGRWFEHGRSLSPEQLRIPMLWRGPGASQRERVERPVSLLDVAPTLLAAAGEPVPDGFAGAQLPRGADPPDAPGVPRALFAERLGEIAVVQGRDYYARGAVPGLHPRLGRLDSEAGAIVLRDPRARADRERVQALERRLAERHPAAEAPSPEEDAAPGDPDVAMPAALRPALPVRPE